MTMDMHSMVIFYARFPTYPTYRYASPLPIFPALHFIPKATTLKTKRKQKGCAFYEYDL